MAAMAQGSGAKVRVLYLLDINKSVDDVALRMMGVYKAHGMKKDVIRMHGWPQEIRMSKEGGDKNDTSCPRSPRASKEGLGGSTNQNQGSSEEAKDPKIPNFSGSFLGHMNRADRKNNRSNDPPLKARSLDEAAWDCYKADPSRFKDIRRFLYEIKEVYKNDKKSHMPDMRLFSQSLAVLYAAAIAETDFIATTPVAAAQAYFAEKFEPDIIFFDEAAHARELATLIPIAFYNSKICVYLGDPRQLKPHVSSNHGICKQLEVSTLLRAMENKAIAAHLLINHRARGGLHELPSKIFYEGKMVSGSEDQDEVPESMRKLILYMNKYRRQAAKTPRLLVSETEARWERGLTSTSSYNLLHEIGIMKLIGELVEAPWFTSVNGLSPGTILVVTPMLESFKRYRKSIKELEPEHQSRIEVRTMSTASGAQADVVFVDIVKPSAFVDDKHRLCVALTRAIQGEFIFMSERMRDMRLTMDGEKPSVYLKQIWDYCVAQREVRRYGLGHVANATKIEEA